jgi:hypothetical protein
MHNSPRQSHAQACFSIPKASTLLSDEADDAQLLLVETYEALIDRGSPMGDSDGDFAATNASKTASRERSGARGRLRDARRLRCLGLLRPDYS